MLFGLPLALGALLLGATLAFDAAFARVAVEQLDRVLDAQLRVGVGAGDCRLGGRGLHGHAGDRGAAALHSPFAPPGRLPDATEGAYATPSTPPKPQIGPPAPWRAEYGTPARVRWWRGRPVVEGGRPAATDLAGGTGRRGGSVRPSTSDHRLNSRRWALRGTRFVKPSWDVPARRLFCSRHVERTLGPARSETGARPAALELARDRLAGVPFDAAWARWSIQLSSPVTLVTASWPSSA